MPPTAPDPGVTVATGDPGAIRAAAGAHAQLADTLDNHATTITTAAASAGGQWQGQAAAAYQAISGTIAAHFSGAAQETRAASTALSQYADELEQHQHIGRNALEQAIEWVAKIVTLEGQIKVAQQAVTQAQSDVDAAQNNFNTICNRSEGVLSPHAIAGASQVLNNANNALAQAMAELAKLQKELQDAEDQLKLWQKKGGEALQAAIAAAEILVAVIGALEIKPPPHAGGPSSADLLKTFIDGAGSDPSSAAIGLATSLMKGYRFSNLVLPSTEAGMQAWENADPAIRAGDVGAGDLYIDGAGRVWEMSPSGLLLPEGTVQNPSPTVEQLVHDSYGDGYLTPGEPTIISESGDLPWSDGAIPFAAPGWLSAGGKVLGTAGVVITAGSTAYDEWTQDGQQHPTWSTTHKVWDTTAVTAGTTGGALAGAWGGATLGAAGGAAIGSVVPIVGTAAGGLIGGIGGGIVGGIAGSAAGRWIGHGISSLGSDVGGWISSL